MAVDGDCGSLVCYRVGKKHFVVCGAFWQVNPLGWDLYDVTVSVGT